MATLSEAGQRAMDLYYQDYAPRDMFLDVDDFKYQIAINYSAMLNALYQKARAENKKEEGWGNVENSAAWLTEETLPVKYDKEANKYSITTSNSVFAFDYDGTGNALQGLHNPKNHDQRFRKISLNERRFLHIIPVTNKTFYYLNSDNEIVFKGKVKEGDEISVQYIPKVVGSKDDCILSDNIIADVITKTLTLMFGAKNGNVIQEANDGNKNAVLGQQVNPQLTKAQQS